MKAIYAPILVLLTFTSVQSIVKSNLKVPHKMSVHQEDRLLNTTKTHIRFFSTTPVEDIESNNYDSNSTINVTTGEFTFVVPMQSFQFKKALMRRHFNQKKFLDTKAHPRSRLVGKILNLNEINFEENGVYTAQVDGEMSIKGVSKPFRSEATVTVVDGVVNVESVFDITLADYGVEFEDGRPSTNVAKTVEVTVKAEYSFTN